MADTLGVINHSLRGERHTNGGHAGRDQSLPYDGRTADTLGVINHSLRGERHTNGGTLGVINHSPTTHERRAHWA